ncbi:MAG TPA: hypothetical protein VEI03_09305 [Stellaceae bacterium]|nr:hypothetical protein [Stellaceae bacterium]
MNKIMYGTVSALALMLAVTGSAMAWEDPGHHDKTKATSLAAAGSDSFVGFNTAAFTDVAGDNQISDYSFQNAAGAFNVAQNESINSSVSQSLAVAAIIGSASDETALAFAGGWSGAFFNHAFLSAVDEENTMSSYTFQKAEGAFNVMQNQSINSAVQQDLAVAAIVDPPTFSKATAVAVSDLGSAVTGNCATGVGIGGWHSANNLENFTFQDAKGAFNVLQNASVNSSVQQSLAVGAIVGSSR